MGNHESMLPDALDNNLFLTEWIQNGVIQRVEFRDQFIKTTRSDLHWFLQRIAVLLSYWLVSVCSCRFLWKNK